MYCNLIVDDTTGQEFLAPSELQAKYNNTWREVQTFSITPPYRATPEGWHPEGQGIWNNFGINFISKSAAEKSVDDPRICLFLYYILTSIYSGKFHKHLMTSTSHKTIMYYFLVFLMKG